MLVAVVMLCILVFILIAYIAFIQKQLRSINRQLDKRLSENTRQPLTIDLFNKTINKLAININLCLKLEEKQRLEGIREQKQFKELISNISHDLRTPLTAIKGYQQLLEKETLSNTQLEKLHTAQKYTDELGDLIEHFFEYSYLITARVEPSLEKINLTNLAIDCVLSYIGIFEEKYISVNIEETPPIYVLGDKNMLTRVIENLLNNCAKHSLGDIDVKIESKSKARITFINPVNPNININVDKLFHRFYTGDSTRNKSTGLGLSIVEFLVEQMNGDVGAYLDTKSNKIAIFFEVPLFI
ncbi:MAG: HAMP domain-containing sensor histidine kinase [Intestinibacter sp.]|uniref:sensor histidine kinase n=1 Tax=Intestinibacter sp. TaxID=1965304 RepID=UPI002A802C8D|nr:HAMP domain-containing sensor histidine kinase [Intestinibacter sp.]MDY4574893.1 HAMP domain-containing sensor histidine kinase [Intestinibacter sp.]